MKKLWEPFGSYLLNSTANPAHFHPNWARLAVLFSRQLPNGSHDFSHIFRIFFLKDFIKNLQTRNARAFLPLNISTVMYSSLHFYCSKVSIFLTTYPPVNANIICESSHTYKHIHKFFIT